MRLLPPLLVLMFAALACDASAPQAPVAATPAPAAPVTTTTQPALVSKASAELLMEPRVGAKVVAALPFGTDLQAGPPVEGNAWRAVRSGTAAGFLQASAVHDVGADGRDAALLAAAETTGKSIDDAHASAFVAALMAAASSTREAETRARLEMVAARQVSAAAAHLSTAEACDASRWPEPFSKYFFYNEINLCFLQRDVWFALASRHPGTRAADECAWTGVHEQAGGECDGDVLCAANDALETYTRYLELQPRGAHAREALRELTEAVSGIWDERGKPKQRLWGDRRSAMKRALPKAVRAAQKAEGEERDRFLAIAAKAAKL